MANINVLAKFILSFEGGFVCHPLDKGGATNMGVTLKTWRSIGYDKDGDGDIDINDLKLLSKDDVINKVLKPHYWDKCKADLIKSQAVANLLVDYAWGSGVVTAVKHIQQIVRVKIDGVFGPKTLEAVNNMFDHALFHRLFVDRRDFIYGIVKRDLSQSVFLKGWMRRLECIKYDCLVCNDGEKILI